MRTFMLLLGLFYGCKVVEPQSVVLDDLQFRDFFCFNDLDSIKSHGYETNGEFIIEIPYRKKIKNVNDIKPLELQEMRNTVARYTQGDLVVVLCQDTCVSDIDMYEDFLEMVDDNQLYYLVLKSVD